MSKSKATAKPAVASGSISAAELGALLSQAGVTKVVMIRHANAAPRDPDAAAAELGVVKPNTPWVGTCNVNRSDAASYSPTAARGSIGEIATRLFRKVRRVT